MNNPYYVLGVPQNATREQINAAYREKARIYSEKNQLSKLDELNEAYDSVILNAGSSGHSQSSTSSSSYSYGYKAVNSYDDIITKINARRLEDAQILLDGIPEASRDAEWYYLKGTVFQMKGWLDQAANMFAAAHGMDPGNSKYRQAYENVVSQQNGGYKTQRSRSSNSGCSGSGCDDSVCSMCMGLLCLDSCCECMGGDCIPGC